MEILCYDCWCVCPFVCLLAGLCKYDKNSEDGSWSKMPLNVESDLDHHFDTKKKKSGFSHLLMFTCLDGVCALQVLLFSI